METQHGMAFNVNILFQKYPQLKIHEYFHGSKSGVI